MSSTDSPSRFMIVDDSNPTITYTGEWEVSDASFGDRNVAGPIHLGSQHTTKGDSRFSFKFRGSNVAVYGTSNKGAGPQPSVQCTVNGVSIETYVETRVDFDANRFPICGEFNATAFQSRTLDVVVSDAPATLFVDYILYQPVPGIRETSHTSMYVANHDWSIEYPEGPWQKIDTGMIGTIPGSRAIISFNGTRVSWHGRMFQNFSSSVSKGTYSIDGQRAVEFDILGFDANPDIPATFDMYEQQFFQTSEVPSGQHTLEVIYGGPASSAPLVLDFLIVDDGPTGPPAKSSSNLGAIVGGVVGGLAFIGIVFAILFFYFRRRKAAATKQQSPQIEKMEPDLTSNSQPGAPMPYLDPHAHQQSPVYTGTTLNSTTPMPLYAHPQSQPNPNYQGPTLGQPPAPYNNAQPNQQAAMFQGQPYPDMQNRPQSSVYPEYSGQARPLSSNYPNLPQPQSPPAFMYAQPPQPEHRPISMHVTPIQQPNLQRHPNLPEPSS
ncbi:hypothetical protein FA15DRAFT_675169 [Coprinopsis marcescibilis]|uniref:Uncharacterized protein n=1 Tax=Coprinopsis marcescibilis TaxID=230819 RepID=A0A5C3KFY7_COPMA|nr:hypothetical protein FA15DRAFT_675169 [Coprinopsis marcescibilis]